ncbi:MAG: tRNA (N6-isopentenyl adenosine(37)-C2)-methylthiotransferase MiaB [Armatimonadetes bacterium]|nr:tRNA (N6-isopentenyl adenosine(37)-C2)-methylthiotransferase MiaB [Armatimonadota bacterium]
MQKTSTILENTGRAYHLITYGCQMNDYDSQRIKALVEELSYFPVSSPQEADLIIFNTCCVRENADLKVYGKIGEFKRLKDKNPELIIIVCGCLAQKDQGKLLERFPQVDLVVGTHNLKDLKDLIKKAENKIRALKTDEIGNEFSLPSKRNKPPCALIPISSGCDCKCTFCIVPFVRGNFHSRSSQEILKEVKALIASGYKEIILLGQNVNAYGKDSPGEKDFISLLEELNFVEGLKRIRYISPHPKDFKLEDIERLAKLLKVSSHIHLPLQSGDDLILKQMKRGYTISVFKNLVERIRNKIPDVSITTDIIAGFPTETEEQFNNTLKFIKEIQFDSAFMFAYSPRIKTPASKIKPEFEEKEKNRRLQELIKLQNEITFSKNKGLEGKIVEVLTEGVTPKNFKRLFGHTNNFKNVVFEGSNDLIGEIVEVKIIQAFTWGLLGKLN